MFTVLINDKKFCAEDGTPLKEILSLYGASLPYSKESALIGRFLDASDQENAKKISYETIIDRDMAIEIDFFPEKEDLSFSTCSLAVNVGDKWVDVCLTDGENAVVRSMVNPLLSIGDLAAQETAYVRDRTAVTETLQKTIEKKCLDLLAEFDRNNVQIAVVCASEFYLKILFGDKKIGLPADNVRILPPIGPYASGELFCESVSLPENTFLIDCEKNLTLLYIGKENDTYTFMWGVDYSELSLLMIRAAMRVIKPEETKPIVRLYGENAYLLEDMLTAEGLSYIHAEKDPAMVAKAVTPSFYAKLEKEKKRTSYHDLLKDENFQEEMNKIYLSPFDNRDID